MNESFNMVTKKKVSLPSDIPGDRNSPDKNDMKISQKTKETMVISTENKFNNNVSVTSL